MKLSINKYKMVYQLEDWVKHPEKAQEEQHNGLFNENKEKLITSQKPFSVGNELLE